MFTVKWRRFALGISTGLLVLFSTSSAWSSYYDLYGFTPRTTAMGGAMTAAVRGYAATFYNPAALTVSKQGHVGLVGHFRAPELFVDRDNAASGDEHPTVMPETGGGASLGWAYPMGGIFEDRLALGVSLHLPIARLVRVQGVDSLSPQFYMYQNLHDKMMFLAAAAFEPVDWLSFGGGVQVLADLTGGAELRLDIVDSRFTRRQFSVDIRPTASANVGVHIRPLTGMAVGLSWRGTSAVRFSVPVSLSEGDTLSMLLDVSQTVQFTPHRFSLGLSYAIPTIDLTVATDTVFSLWSLAPDPSPQLRVDMGGPVFTALGLGSAMDVSVDAKPLEMRFRDTVSLRLGLEWAGVSWLHLRGGYTYRPTPAPPQREGAVYLDNDAHVVAFGTGFTFFDPLGVHAHPLSVDLAAQAVILPTREVERLDPEDPFGSLRHGGQIWSLSLSISHAY